MKNLFHVKTTLLVVALKATLHMHKPFVCQ